MRTDDSYDARVAKTLAELGIPASYGVDRHMPFYAEAKDLVSVGMDYIQLDRMTVLSGNDVAPTILQDFLSRQEKSGIWSARIRNSPIAF